MKKWISKMANPYPKTKKILLELEESGVDTGEDVLYKLKYSLGIGNKKELEKELGEWKNEIEFCEGYQVVLRLSKSDEVKEVILQTDKLVCGRIGKYYAVKGIVYNEDEAAEKILKLTRVSLTREYMMNLFVYEFNNGEHITVVPKMREATEEEIIEARLKNVFFL